MSATRWRPYPREPIYVHHDAALRDILSRWDEMVPVLTDIEELDGSIDAFEARALRRSAMRIRRPLNRLIPKLKKRGESDGKGMLA